MQNFLITLLLFPFRLIRNLLIRLIVRPVLLLNIRWHGNYIYRNKAIRTAKRKHRLNGLRYRVIFLDKRYQVICRNDIRNRKKEGSFNYYINSTKLDPFVYFDTNSLKTT